MGVVLLEGLGPSEWAEARRTRRRTKGRVSLAASISPETTVACLARLLSSLLVPPGPHRASSCSWCLRASTRSDDRPASPSRPIDIWESNALQPQYGDLTAPFRGAAPDG